jgi:hypothetical protein
MAAGIGTGAITLGQAVNPWSERSRNDPIGVLGAIALRLFSMMRPDARWHQEETQGISVGSRQVRAAVGALDELFDFAEFESVSAFLAGHDFLLPLLIEAQRKIGEYFGTDSTTRLEVVGDPGDPSDVSLYAFIQTFLPHADAVALLDSFDREWWLNELDRARHKLVIDVASHQV